MKTGFPTPEQIGPYRVIGCLGRGGMGEVLHGHDDRLGRPVALKRILPDIREPEKALRRFQREARAVASLSHPAIVQVHDWAESEGQHWMVMELVEGHSLDEMIADGPLSPGRALEIARDIASGLAEAHDAGLVHRDLKTKNILIDTKGRAKILDFGLAKTVRLEGSRTDQAKAPSTTLTGEGHIVGTVTAMSPEQAMGKKVDHRSDLFSLGVLLYEMLSGVRPFKGDSAIEILARICSAQEEALHHLDQEIPEDVSSLVTQLLQKDPARRPRDAHQVVAEIDRLTAAESDVVSPSAAGWQGTTRVDLQDTDSVQQPKKTSIFRSPGRYLGLAPLVAVALVLWGSTIWLQSSGGEASRIESVAVLPPRAEPTPYELYQRGMRYLERSEREGNIDKAITDFQKALAKDQDFAPALAGLAEAYRLDHFHGSMDPQRLDQALAAAERAVDINEHLAISWISLGWVHFAMGRLDEASQEFETALRIEPSNVYAQRGLGEVREAQGDLKQAESLYRRASEADPEEAEYLGVLYFRTGRYEEAAAAFLRSLEKVPDNFRILSNLGATYYMQGRLSEASKQFQNALLIRPDSTLYSNVGTIYFTQGLYAQSVSAFKKAIENGGSNNYLLWGNLGDARRWTPGQEAEAREAYLRAIQLLHENAATESLDLTEHTRLVLYLAKRGDCTAALAEIGEIGSLPANEGNAWFRVAVANEVCHHRAAALAALQAALRTRFSIEEIRRDPELLALRQDIRYHELALKHQASSGG